KQTQNDYMEEFLPRQSRFLEVLIENEAPPSPRKCAARCGKTANWRCVSCLGSPVYCIKCLRFCHERTPLHKVEVWTSTPENSDEGFFRPSSLLVAGVKVNLGHGGFRCPATIKPSVDSSEEGVEVEEELEVEEDIPPILADNPDLVLQYDRQGNPIVVTVDSSGVHRVAFRRCQCADCWETEDIQFLRLGFYPASYQQIKTVFTFSVLDDFLADNRECKTSCYQYFEKLRARTASTSLDDTPNRYHELSRVIRQWRLMKYLKWFGFAHSKKTPGRGELALFCATCPQPGINLPDDWEDDEDELLYMRSFVMDGNFTASHLKPKHPENDVRLTDGTGMMTSRGNYEDHLSKATEKKAKNDCNATRALNARIQQVGTRATGIGATACARHGCFAPCSVVDFQKGERQANMDYSLYQALKSTNIKSIKHILEIYDVMCQFSKHMEERWEEGEYLEWPSDKVLHQGIGTFHVRGHVARCFHRYALSYIQGAGMIDGEILETLWSVLNHISPCTRGASEAHRDEILDDHMNHSNWKKLVRMPRSLVSKFFRAERFVEETADALEGLTEKNNEADIEQWTLKAQEVQEQRLNKVEAMDWYTADVPKDPGRADRQLQLVEKELKEPKKGLRGIAAVLSDGLRIEEIQYVPIPTLPKNNTNEELDAEDIVMILPSKFRKSTLDKMGLGQLRNDEIELRCGQATDALDDLRSELGRKAFEHVQKRKIPSKKHKTRGWMAIHNQEAKVREITSIYRMARKSL
ncbi:hypothetical protein BDN72DRAFT_734315, partial [Pluteus cervinus]